MKLKDLNKQIPYQWRVQSFGPNTAACVAYIDSRDVQIMLDEICEPHNWQCDYKEIKGNLFCGIGILCGDQWVWKWDCGTESNTEKEKGEASDSFKRAAVKWGIGRFLYDLSIVRVKWVEKNGKKYPADDKGEPIYDGADLTAFINARQAKLPQNNASLYNHKPIGKKPAISNKAFKETIERIEKGEFDLIDKVQEHFSLDATQQSIIDAKKLPA